MTEYCCMECGKIVPHKEKKEEWIHVCIHASSHVHASSHREFGIDKKYFVEWLPVCEKLAASHAATILSVIDETKIHLGRIERARLWIVENVLKAGWTNET